MHSAPDVWHALLERLAELTLTFLRVQAAAGVDAVQLFDSWVGCLSPDDYRRYVLPYLKQLIAAIVPGVPVIVAPLKVAYSSEVELRSTAQGPMIPVWDLPEALF